MWEWKEKEKLILYIKVGGESVNWSQKYNFINLGFHDFSFCLLVNFNVCGIFVKYHSQHDLWLVIIFYLAIHNIYIDLVIKWVYLNYFKI